MIPDKKIISNCLKGNRQSQRELYERYKSAFFILLQRYATSRNEAQDLLQDGFVKIFGDLDSYDPDKGAFYTWGRMVMVNTALQHLRKRRILFVESDIDHFNDKISIHSGVISELNLQDLTKIISSLPVGYRVVFNMFVIEGYTHQEIANKLDITVNTSKSQLFKAKKALRKKIEHRDIQDKLNYESK